MRILEDTITNPEAQDYEISEAEIHLDETQAKLGRAQLAVRAQESALGITEQAQLRLLVNNPYINIRMNARALKVRLRERLRGRKFEMDRLERSYRKQVNGRLFLLSELTTPTDSVLRTKDTLSYGGLSSSA